jgi:hypothetical protein
MQIANFAIEEFGIIGLLEIEPDRVEGEVFCQYRPEGSQSRGSGASGWPASLRFVVSLDAGQLNGPVDFKSMTIAEIEELLLARLEEVVFSLKTLLAKRREGR